MTIFVSLNNLQLACNINSLKLPIVVQKIFLLCSHLSLFANLRRTYLTHHNVI